MDTSKEDSGIIMSLTDRHFWESDDNVIEFKDAENCQKMVKTLKELGVLKDARIVETQKAVDEYFKTVTFVGFDEEAIFWAKNYFREGFEMGRYGKPN